MNNFTKALGAVTGLVTSLAVWAHHSDAGMNMTSVVAFEGTVAEFGWRNPHVYVIVSAPGKDGKPVEWSLQMGSTIVQTRRGWAPDSLAHGDRVRVRAHPAEDGRPYGILVSIEKDGGIMLSAEPYAPDVSAHATSIEGIWMADRHKLVNYPGGIDGFFKSHFVLTEKAKAAEAAYDPLSAENPESHCIGRPPPGSLLSTNLYPLQFKIDEAAKTITIHSEFFDEERTVYMDGRKHPEHGERTLLGHSIGWWEGDTLVVDTRLFADHRSPYQIGVPSGAGKHVVERYRLNQDHTRMTAQFWLEDPEYLVQPITATRELVYSPGMKLYKFNCDAEVTKRFLAD